jgi:outer membrane protein
MYALAARQTLSFALALALTTMAAGAVAAPAHAEETAKVATVDMQKALQTVEAGKKAKAQLEKEFNALKKQIDGEEAAINKMGEEFKKQSLVMNDEARAKKQAELQERIMKYQETRARSQMEISKKEKDLTAPIITKLRGVIADIAKGKGYTIVIEKNENTVLYSLEKDDLTSDVISTFNKNNKADAGAPASATLASSN